MEDLKQSDTLVMREERVQKYHKWTD